MGKMNEFDVTTITGDHCDLVLSSISLALIYMIFGATPE